MFFYSLDISSIVTIVLFILLAVLVAKGVRTVSQGEEWVVERFGRYQRTLVPGLSVIIPLFDRVAYRVITKDIVLDIDRQEVITSDNAVIMTNAVAFIKVTDPVASVYGVVDYRLAVRNLVQTALRSIVGEMTLDDALSSRENIKTKLRGMVADDMTAWGITLKTVEIQDIQPSPSMQQAMEQQSDGTTSRRRARPQGDGHPRRGRQAIGYIGGRRTFGISKRDAEAEVTLADASKKAILLVRETTNDESLPLYYLLGQRYVEAIKNMAASENAKFVVLPADLQNAVRGSYLT